MTTSGEPFVLDVLDALARLALAFVLVLPLGWEREHRTRSAGLRTYPLLSVCVCGFLLIAQRIAWGPAEQADVIYGVLGGIGFVASGALLSSPANGRGMSTAVSLWATGAIGAAVALGATAIACVVALVSLCTLGISARAWRQS